MEYSFVYLRANHDQIKSTCIQAKKEKEETETWFFEPHTNEIGSRGACPPSPPWPEETVRLMAFFQAHRLRSHADITRLMRAPGRVQTAHFRFSFSEKKEGVWRIGVLTPVRIFPTAVRRHQAKRRLQEAIKSLTREYSFKEGVDVLIVWTTHTQEMRPADIAQELFPALKKSGILIP